MDRKKLKKKINRIITLVILFSVVVSSCLVSYASESKWVDAEFIDDAFRSRLLDEECVFDESIFGNNSVSSLCYNVVQNEITRLQESEDGNAEGHPFYGHSGYSSSDWFTGSVYGYVKPSSASTDCYPFRYAYFSYDDIVMTFDKGKSRESCRLLSRSEIMYEIFSWDSAYLTTKDVNTKPTGSRSASYGYTKSSYVLDSNNSYTYYVMGGGDIGFSSQQIYLYNAPFKIFDTVEHAVNYLYTGDETGLLYKPKEKVIAKPDNTLGFQYVTLRKYYSPYTSGCQNAMFQFALKNDTVERIDGTWKLVVNLSLDYRVRVQNGNTLVTELVGDEIDSGSINLKYEESCKNFVSSDGSVLFNLIDLYGNPYERAFQNGSVFPEFSESAAFVRYCKALKGEEESLGVFYDLITGYASKTSEKSGALGDIFGSFVSGTDDYSYTFDFITLSLDCYLLNKDGTIRSQGGIATLDFNTGQNSGNVSDVSESGDYTPVDGSEHSDRNDYQVSTDGDGNTAIYYYDYSDHSVTNVTNPSSGGSGNVTQNNNVSIPDTINVNINQPDNGLGNVTIEDDDMSLETITRTLKEGFGILDDVDTDKKGDGYPSMLSYLYSFLPSDFSVMPLLGIASLTGLAILERLIFRK